MCNHDLIIEKIANLSQKIDTNTDHSRRELDTMNERLLLINQSILAVNDKVNIQNGRVSDIENTQKHCPGVAVNTELKKYKSDLRPVYILATNLKLIALMVIAATILFNIVDIAFDYLLKLVNL